MPTSVSLVSGKQVPYVEVDAHNIRILASLATNRIDTSFITTHICLQGGFVDPVALGDVELTEGVQSLELVVVHII